MIWRSLYTIITWLALPLVLGYFYWRGRREPAYRAHWRERLGYGLRIAPGAIWVHAASVGEVMLVAPLVQALQTAYPQRALLLTTMTPTGRARAQAQFANTVVHQYVPLDTIGATRRFLRRARPRLAILAETELWPNLIAAAADCNVPVVLVNASLSPRSAQRYARWPLARATRFMLERICLIAAASADHARRFRGLGAPASRVQLVGNLKYDRPESGEAGAAGSALRRQWQAKARPVWVAASTHEGEETLLLSAVEHMREYQPDVLLVIAPRHPQRFDAVHDALIGSGRTIARRSRHESVSVDTDIVLADTLGEVPTLYAAADVIFVGGSLLSGIGGHNVIEAAASARPVCVGPHIDDWREVVDALVDLGAAQVCDTPDALARTLGQWLDNPEQRIRDGTAGADLVRANAGALQRTLLLLRPLIDGPDSPSRIVGET